MRHRKFVHLAGVVSIIAGVIAGIPRQALAAPPREPDAPLDVPDILVSGGVGDYTVAAPKVFWYLRDCVPYIGLAAADNNGAPVDPAAPSDPTAPIAPVDPAAVTPQSPDAANLTDSESIRRIAVQGSEQRQLFAASANGYCGALAHTKLSQSNMVADANYLYWITDQGLMRLSVNANVGDAPEVFNGAITSPYVYYVELAQDNDYVYALTHASNTQSTIRRISKADGTSTTLRSFNALATQLQVSHAFGFGIPNYVGDYVYWIDGGVLRRLNLNNLNDLQIVASGVTIYHAEGGRLNCGNFICQTTDLVFFSVGRYLYRTSNRALGSVTLINDTGNNNDTIYSIVTDANFVFYLQEHFVPCSPSPCFGGTWTDYVVRHARDNSGTTDFLSISRIDSLSGRIYKSITTADSRLMWQADSAILRLPNNAAALPKINMRVTGLSITQGIQTPTNSVGLIRDRRTFVRAFVQSDGPGSVSGVTARLYRLDALNQVIDSVMPVNSVGTNITVRTSPQRANLNDSFLFELPWSWVSGSSVRLRVVVNPYHYQLEPSYADNESNSGALSVKASPALNVRFVSWGYTVNGTDYYPRLIKDILQSYSWILRAYPLSSRLVFDDGNAPGFHPRLIFQYDSGLGARVMGTHSSCQDLYWKDGDGNWHDDRNLCASRYTNSQTNWIRIVQDGFFSAIFNPKFYYGMISDGAAFPRGQACCGTKLSTGPAGSGTWGWDNDGSYADWYAAHEIGHTLGRAHPSPGSAACGQSASDPSYPYTGAQIGASNNYEGFDAGDSFYSVPRAVYPGTTWYDVMSYCDNQWISDYTYRGMYNFMTGGPLVMSMGDESELPILEMQPEDGVKTQPASAQSALVSGDWLMVQGTIINGTNTASLQKLTRLSETAGLPAIVAGGYSIRLTDMGGSTLADYPFTPTPGEEATPDLLGVSQIVTMTAGARQVRIVRLSDGLTLATQAISANAPVVSNVALQSPSNPVAGTVTLAWNASDADGDALTFDVFYSNNGGSSFVSVQSGVSGNSASIDTSTLGGGNGFFRVVASDGVNTGQADSPAYTFADKPPMPMILTPGDNHVVNYGQLVNFSGAAMDWQDGGITGANLEWSNQNGVLGTGELLSVSNLPVGVNTITLKATNSKGQSATATITVIVNDDLSLLGPTMTAGPTQLDWTFAADATTPAPQVLHLGNAGSDTSAQWVASNNAPWLSVSPASGTLPGDITLTADPSGVPNGSSLTGTVTIVLPASGNAPEQTINIPVSLSKGFNPANPKGQSAQFKVFTPITLR